MIPIGKPHRDPTLVTIKEAAAMTGVSEYTLRAWEDRYHVVTPRRTASGYRHYSEDDLHQIRTMTALMADGLAPRAAAAEVLRRRRLGSQGDPFAGFLAAAATLDAKGLDAELGRRFGSYDFDTLVGLWLLPALERLGAAWSAGQVSVAGEHLVAAQLMRRLSTAYDLAAPQATGATVLIGAPPGVDHQLGILAFAVACRRRGLDTTYLGNQLPISAWQDAVAHTRPRAVVTTIPRRRDAASVAKLATALDSTSTAMWVGGRYQRLAAAPAQPLGHDIPRAAQALASALATAPETTAEDPQRRK